MAACDVLVNLRSPTMGETSGAVIRALSLGKPMLVSRRRLVRGAAGRRRAEGAGRRVRGRDDRAPRSSSLADRADGARRARARATSRASTTSTHVADLRRRARGGRRAAPPSTDAVLCADRRGRRRGRDRAGTLAPSSPRALREAGLALRCRAARVAARARSPVSRPGPGSPAIVVVSASSASRSRRADGRARGSWSTSSSTPSSRRASPRHGHFLCAA